MKELLRKSFMAGIAIGIGGFACMAVGGIGGAVLFSFGLITVYLFGLKLYTGMAGRTPYTFSGHAQLLIALLANIIGAVLVGLLARLSPLDSVHCNVTRLVETRLSTGAWQAGLLAIGCGFIVDEAVHSYRRTKTLFPTVIGVTVFIVCGMPHCVADAFFIGLAPTHLTEGSIGTAALTYASVVAGNYVGCNIRRWALGIEED